jgi:hypothetical protein
MGQATLSALWISSFKATKEEANQLHVRVLLLAHGLDHADLVSHVSATANGLVQFMIMPTASREGWPDSNNWETLALHVAKLCAGTNFSVKRVYVASN